MFEESGVVERVRGFEEEAPAIARGRDDALALYAEKAAL